MERLSRRNVIGAAGAIVAGSGLPASAALAARGGRVAEVIAEYQKHAAVHLAAQTKADEALFAAFPDPEGRPDPWYPREGLSPYLLGLYAETDRLYEAMNEAYNRVLATPCESLADVIAKLEWDEFEDHVDDIVRDLRAIAKRGGVA
jgi:hypothetical protein